MSPGTLSWSSLVVLATAATTLALDTDPHGAAWANPIDGMKFVWVPAGACSLGASGSGVQTAGASPDKLSFTNGFWMGRTEVTVAQFARFAKKTGYLTDAERAGNRWTWRNPGFKQSRRHPAVYLNAHDAVQYTRWAEVDLPTEGEWLYACRAGSTNRYYWGDEVDDRFVWHRGNSEAGAQPVATKRPNGWGLYDMVGNAWEYCKIGECKPGHQCFAQRGSSWTRCPHYLTRQGFVAENLLAEGTEPRLHPCDPTPEHPPYPWDDDRGFRCVRRVGPAPKGN